MARTKKEIKARKQTLRASLNRILAEYRVISSEMAEVPTKYRGVAQQSLDRRTGEYVMHTGSAIFAAYIAQDRKRYSIQINARGFRA